MGPIDYSMDVQTPFQAALQGYQAGAAIRNDRNQQAAQELALKQQQQKQQLLSSLASNPNATGDDYARVITQIPELSEHLNRAWTLRNTEQQQSHAADLLKWGAAIKSGSPEVAVSQMNQKADAMEAAAGGPTDESKALRANAQVLEYNPKLALGQIQAMLAVNPNGKQAADSLAAFGAEQRAEDLAPANLLEANSKASSAATAAKFAESKAVQDLRMGDEQIKKWAADTEIARQNSRIAAMNASIAREGNDLKRQELSLKVQEAIQARDDKLRTKVAEVDSARSTIDNTINTIDKLFKNPAWKDVVGSFEGRMPESASMLDDKESDAIATINTIGSQVFLSAVKGAGSMTGLTEKEGDKLQSSLASLGRAQSEQAFEANAKEAQRLLLKARKNLVIKYGVPDTVPDTPNANPSGAEVDDLVRKYTGGK